MRTHRVRVTYGQGSTTRRAVLLVPASSSATAMRRVECWVSERSDGLIYRMTVVPLVASMEARRA